MLFCTPTWLAWHQMQTTNMWLVVCVHSSRVPIHSPWKVREIWKIFKAREFKKTAQSQRKFTCISLIWINYHSKDVSCYIHVLNYLCTTMQNVLLSNWLNIKIGISCLLVLGLLENPKRLCQGKLPLVREFSFHGEWDPVKLLLI